MTEQTFEDENGEPYEYLPVSSNTPSQVRRNALGKALCLAELDSALRDAELVRAWLDDYENEITQPTRTDQP
jgi:hypothetical protein